MNSSLCVILLSFLCFFVNLSLSDPRATEAALICSNETTSSSNRQDFISNFLSAMESLTPLVSSQRYAAISNGSGNATVYAFGECMKDLSASDCNLCFAQCKTQILRCRPFQLAITGGRLFYDGCYLRYDDYNFFNQSLSGEDQIVCGKNAFVGDKDVFKGNVMELVRNLSVEGYRNDGFSVSEVRKGNVSVYGLAQCWELVKGNGCLDCLNEGVRKIGACEGKSEGRVLNAGCYLRYSTEKFYYNSTRLDSDGGNGGRRSLSIILASVCAAVAVLVTIGTLAFFAWKKMLKKRRERKQLGALVETVNNSKLNFSYEILEKATNYFDNSNKLGQGGSGSVYKGVLPDGKVVAIKRLFFNSRQWVDHFFNEVNLISTIQHKNLLKLLGCSITGPESLLVYEYVPNQSLHDYFVVNKNLQPLSWQVRYKIILGTAEGLAYLHEESELRIIHRDIKLSNILLEEDFTPKIADFGLARLFPQDVTHISTAIAGTLGYMAPEYVVRGKLSEKADIYSFGVLLIEILSGKRNNFFSENSSILQMVWNLYGLDKLCEVVDPILAGNYREDQARCLLQIGLLCVQASAELRPAMSMVVKMISEDIEIPRPKQPPFLSSTSSSETRPRIPSRGYNSLHESYTHSSRNDMTESLIEPR